MRVEESKAVAEGGSLQRGKSRQKGAEMSESGRSRQQVAEVDEAWQKSGKCGRRRQTVEASGRSGRTVVIGNQENIGAAVQSIKQPKRLRSQTKPKLPQNLNFIPHTRSFLKEY